MKEASPQVRSLVSTSVSTKLLLLGNVYHNQSVTSFFRMNLCKALIVPLLLLFQHRVYLQLLLLALLPFYFSSHYDTRHAYCQRRLTRNTLETLSTNTKIVSNQLHCVFVVTTKRGLWHVNSAFAWSGIVFGVMYLSEIGVEKGVVVHHIVDLVYTILFASFSLMLIISGMAEGISWKLQKPLDFFDKPVPTGSKPKEEVFVVNHHEMNMKQEIRNRWKERMEKKERGEWEESEKEWIQNVVLNGKKKSISSENRNREQNGELERMIQVFEKKMHS